MAASMNYVWGVFEMCQQPTPTLLRCRGTVNIHALICSGRLWGRQMPTHDACLFFSNSSTLFLSLHSSTISLISLPPTPTPPVQFHLSALLESPLFIYPSERLEESKSQGWLKVYLSPFLSSLCLSQAVCWGDYDEDTAWLTWPERGLVMWPRAKAVRNSGVERGEICCCYIHMEPNQLGKAQGIW